MSTSIDEKVLAMKLNNADFESNAKRSLGTLKSLTDSLKLTGATKGLQGLGDAAKNTNLGALASSVEGIGSKFTALGVLGVAALATIANKAVNVGLQMAKSLTISPIAQGFAEYELKLGSIQTIMAGTGESLATVNDYLGKLNEYSDKTIYSFADMTTNIGKFTNAGVSLKDSVASIQGVANVAALSGANAGEASRAMYNFAQALSKGYVQLVDWKSIELANMGTKEFKQQLIDSAVATGTLTKKGNEYVTSSGKKLTATKGFNEALGDQFLTTEALNKTLARYSDETTDIGKRAFAAAQDVKTFSQLMDTLKEAVGSGWAQSFEIIFGDFNEAKSLFTNVNNVVSGMIKNSSDARNKLLTDWDLAGGRTALIDGLSNAFKALMSIIKPIGDAFRQMFPPATGKQLADMTKTFRDFTKGLILGKESSENLKRTFAGVFAIFKVGYTIIKGVVTTLFSLFGIAQGGAGSFLSLTASVGDFLVKIEEWLVSSGRIKSFFSTINTARAAVLVPLIAIITKVVDAFKLLFSGDTQGFVNKLGEAFSGVGALIQAVFNSLSAPIRNFLANARDATGVASEFLKSLGISAFKPIQDALARLSENLGKLRSMLMNVGLDLFSGAADGAAGAANGLSSAGDKVSSAWESAKNGFKNIKEFISPAADAVGELFVTITNKIKEFIQNLDFNDALAIINTAFFIAMYKTIKEFVSNLDGLVGTFKGIGTSITGSLDQLTSTFKTMQQGVKANIVIKIAIAIGILALSLKLLSTIDPGKLVASVAAVGVLMFMMTKAMGGMMSMLDVVDGEAPKKIGSVLAVGGAMLLLAAAILVLSFAVKNLSGLSWEEMAKGLIATGVLLGALALFTKFADTETDSIKGAVGIVLLAGAIYLLSMSVQKLGEMDTNKLVQGSVAVAALLVILGEVSRRMSDPKALAGAAGIIALAVALAILAPVITGLGLLPYEVLGKGLTTVALVLGMLAIASAKMGTPETMAGAAGILALAIALAILAPVLTLLGLVPYEVLGKGLATIGIALGLLAIASQQMGDPKSIAGAAGILAMAVALAVLAPVIILLGTTPWQALAIGLGVVAVALGIFLLAGLAAMYVGPGLLVLGGSLLLFGAGIALAGAGMLLFATAFAAFAAIGVAGFAVLTVGFTSLLQLIPLMAQQVGLGIIAIAAVISKSGPVIIRAITVVLIAFLKAIQNSIPQFMSTMTTLIMALVTTISRLVPRIAAQGAMMILRLLAVIATFVGPIAQKATDLIIAMINAIAKNVPRLVDAGAKAIIALVNGVANAIRNNQAEMNAAGRNLAGAIVDGMVSAITGGISAVTNAAKNLAKNALNAAKSFLGINSPSKEFIKVGQYVVAGFVQGLKKDKPAADAAISTMATTLSSTLRALDKKVASAESVLKKLTSARKKDTRAIAKQTAALNELKSEQSRIIATQALLKTMTNESSKIGKLADNYQLVTLRLEDAKKALEEAKGARLSIFKSINDQYEKLPNFDKETKLSDFVSDLEKQVVNTQIYRAQLEELGKQGLNADVYQQLVSKGIDGMGFAQQLLEGGKASVNQVNTLSAALSKASEGLATTASADLYYAGVKSAEGLVKGLQGQQTAITKQMTDLANVMVAAIKAQLGIKSPSRAFMEIGRYSSEGLAKGLEKSATIPAKAASQVGHEAIKSLRKSLTGLSEIVLSDIDIDPTIRPVLDLSEIRKSADQIGSLLQPRGLSVAASFANARGLSAEYDSRRSDQAELALANSSSTTYNQYINSPKALSTAEIYRQTNNQISKVVKKG